MNTSLHVLIVDDSEDDTFLLVRQLKRGGYEVEFERVETHAGMDTALNIRMWDVILADYTLPDFSALAALQLLHEKGLDIPFIIVSGIVGEDAVVEALKAGAHDFFSKDKLVRLVPAVERELREADNRKKRREAEQALRNSEAFYRSVISVMGDGVVLHHADGSIVACNPSAERILGLTQDQIMGRTSFDPRWSAIHEDGTPFSGETHPAAVTLRTGEPQSNVIMGVHKPSGELTWISINSRSLLNEHRLFPYALVVTFTDITHLKRAESQQRELAVERAKITTLKHLVEHASHDLRTPLAVIKTVLYLLRKHADPENIMRHVDTLEERTNNMEKIIENLLDFADLDRTVTGFRFIPCELNQLVGELLAEQQSLVDARNQSVRLDLDLTLPIPMADRAEMKRALTHLLVNAFHYTPEGGTITLSTDFQDQKVILKIQDTGIGISEAELPFIFEPFYRVDKARNTATGGAGLGLPIARAIVEAHGGHISVESVLGQGSTFTVTIPLHNHRASSHSAAIEPDTPTAP